MNDTKKRKFILGKSFYIASIGMLLIGIAEIVEGIRMGTVPESVLGKNAASIMETRRGKHWVRISGLLTDCQKPYDEIENGKKGRTLYLASDVEKKQTFILNSPSECNASETHVYEGTLEIAPTYVKKLLADAGVSSDLKGEPLYLSVGEKAAGSTQTGLVLEAAGLTALMATWWSRRQLNR